MDDAVPVLLVVSAFSLGASRDAMFPSTPDNRQLAFVYVSVAFAVPIPAYLYLRVAERFGATTCSSSSARLRCWRRLLGCHFLLWTHARWLTLLLYNFVESPDGEPRGRASLT